MYTNKYIQRLLGWLFPPLTIHYSNFVGMFRQTGGPNICRLRDYSKSCTRIRLIDLIEFYAVSTICQACNGGDY